MKIVFFIVVILGYLRHIDPAMSNHIPTATAATVKISPYTGGLTITPLQNGCIILDCVGFTLYRRAHLPLAMDWIKAECVFPPELERQVMDMLHHLPE